MTAILTVKNLVKKFQNRIVCDNISLHCPAGKIIGLFGANGAGKSTCFHMITGLIMPDSGEILINQTHISHLRLHERAAKGLCFLPQDKSIFHGLTVEQNILAVAELFHKNKKQQLEALLNYFNLSNIRHTPASLLSGGQRRRTEVARAMAAKPKFLCLDEPFSGIDPISIKEIINLLKKLQMEKNIGILITDHHVTATLPFCDYAYILHNGKILANGTPQNLKNNVRAREHYLGDILD